MSEDIDKIIATAKARTKKKDIAQSFRIGEWRATGTFYCVACQIQRPITERVRYGRRSGCRACKPRPPSTTRART
jgi:hypothetical protein